MSRGSADSPEAALRAVRPDAAPHDLVPLGSGLDHAAYRHGDLAVLGRSVPAASPVRVPVHQDLGAEHLIVRDGELAGVIDWSDAVIGDPAVDLARLLRDFGPEFLDALMRGYRGPVDTGLPERVLFCARCTALEDLAYGEETGRREYVDNALRALTWLSPE